MSYTKDEIDKLINKTNKEFRANWDGKMYTISVSKTIEHLKSKFDVEKQARSCS